MSKRNVLLVFGGESSEHDVSIASARNVYAALDDSKYDTMLCFIDKAGKWWLLDEWIESPRQHGGVQLLVAPGTGSLMTVPGGQIIHPDVILPVLHGKNGEDGSIQGLAQLLHVPIVGCDVESSALCMNKQQTKIIISAAGRPVADWVSATASTIDHAINKASRLGDVVFVKPARAGSSVGVSKVTSPEGLRPAIELALTHDDLVLIERAIIGRELEVAVLGNPPHHQASGVGEIIPGSEFYDYDDKYSSGSSSQTVLDANLPEAQIESIRQYALEAYELLGCRGLARVDFLLAEDGTVYLNEVNTLPGFTNISMYPKLWQRVGIRYPELVDRLIQLAFE